ncbi:FH2 domain-containing protein 1-like [Ixodes scapularis]|uniref:FH2 domain-containing protein 1-like n=1 Tax=Ixodes scapularis TaxID=6945 RepID=UPI001AD70BB4|nr:FH2 domain-containing protein 1-like [Ixodes scapularis]
MELRGGLDYVLQHPEHTRTLAAALASGDASVRQQVWQLLASLCTHGEGEGLRRALSTLEQLAALQGQRGRLAPLAHALAQPAAPQAALLTLANCALSSRDRARLRAELRARGVKVPPALGSSPAPTTPAPTKDSPLASSPALHRQALATLASLAAGGPNREAQLLRLLERLPTLADDAWEKLGAAEPTTRCDCTRQQAAAKETRASPSSCPAPPAAGPPPPPPPPPPQARQDELLELLAASPAPRVKMRSLNWTKIPAHKVLSGPNLWRRVAQSQSRPPELDFGHLEGLFCQPPEGTWPRTAVSRTGDPPGRTEAGEVRLLDAQRSLHLGIFLKQLRGQVSEGFLLELLSRGSGGQLKLGAERVRSLLALLPASEAASQLEKALADAEPALLAPPEAFLARLLRLPNYRLRIESLLLQEELPSVVASLESSMTCLRKAAREIQECDALHQILFLILVAGNFLNSGGYAGNAAGFRVMSLLKVIELRSNRPGVSLLHYVAQQADRAGLVSGLSLATLEPACRVSGDQVRAEVGALADRLARLRGDAAAAAADDQEAFLARTDALLALAQRELERLRRSLRSLDKARADLADFFCEDLVGFTLEECFRVLATFCRSFKAAVQDNQRRAESPLRCPAEVRLRDEHGGTTSASSPDASPSGSLRRSFRISRPSSRPSSSELGSEDQLMDFLRQSTSDREDSLGRRSRREARRRVAAETFDDGSRERVPSTDAKVCQPPS